MTWDHRFLQTLLQLLGFFGRFSPRTVTVDLSELSSLTRRTSLQSMVLLHVFGKSPRIMIRLPPPKHSQRHLCFDQKKVVIDLAQLLQQMMVAHLYTEDRVQAPSSCFFAEVSSAYHNTKQPKISSQHTHLI